jgi:hypothetical protein
MLPSGNGGLFRRLLSLKRRNRFAARLFWAYFAKASSDDIYIALQTLLSKYPSKYSLSLLYF